MEIQNTLFRLFLSCFLVSLVSGCTTLHSMEKSSVTGGQAVTYDLPYEKAQPLTASILQVVFEPFLHHATKKALPQAEDEE